MDDSGGGEKNGEGEWMEGDPNVEKDDKGQKGEKAGKGEKGGKDVIIFEIYDHRLESNVNCISYNM